MPGPPPTPTSLLKARGSWRANVREGEPEPTPWVSDAPDFLTDSARTTWDLLSAQLGIMGVLGGTDRNLLARYCTKWAEWLEVQAGIADGTHSLLTPDGDMTGAAMLSLKLGEQLTKLESQLGLTPAARASLSRPKPAKKDGKAAFFDDAQGAG